MKELTDYTTTELELEIRRRKAEEREKALKKCFFKCKHCQKRTHLSKWSVLYQECYEDNVYTSHAWISDDITLICPKCHTRIFGLKKFQYEHHKADQYYIDGYNTQLKFSHFTSLGGKPANEYLNKDYYPNGRTQNGNFLKIDGGFNKLMTEPIFKR